MAAIHFNRDYFFPKLEDGNLSLSTQELRIKEAVSTLNPGDWIQLEDGTRCTTKEELKRALNLSDSNNTPKYFNGYPQVHTIICPNCGANAKNTSNCEYCGSYLVQNVARGQDVSAYVEKSKGYHNAGLLKALNKLSYLLQNRDCGFGVYIYHNNDSFLQVYSNELMYGKDTPHKGFCIQLFGNNLNRFNCLGRFLNSDVIQLFNKSQDDDNTVDIYLIDFGYDTEGACRLLIQLIEEVFQFDSNECCFKLVSPEDDDNYVLYNKNGVIIDEGGYGKGEFGNVEEMRESLAKENEQFEEENKQQKKGKITKIVSIIAIIMAVLIALSTL